MIKVRWYILFCWLLLVIANMDNKVYSQCLSDRECREGRICKDGVCQFRGCKVDIDCPEPFICEEGRCILPQGVQGKKEKGLELKDKEDHFLLPPPLTPLLEFSKGRGKIRPSYIEPVVWGGRGGIGVLPKGGSVFELSYTGGDYLSSSQKGTISGFQIMTGSENVIGSIFSLGIYYPLLQYMELATEVYHGASLSMGDLVFKFLVMLFSKGDNNYWIALSPYLRFSVNFASYDIDYLFLFEGGLAFGFVYRLFSITVSGEFLSYFEENEKILGSLFYVTPGLKLTSFMEIIATLGIGYIDHRVLENVVIALYPSLRFNLKDKVKIDLVFKVALNDGGVYIDQGNSIPSSFGVGFRISVEWYGGDQADFP